MESTLIMGRWANSRTARLYIQTGAAELVKLRVSDERRALFALSAPRLRAYAQEHIQVSQTRHKTCVHLQR